MTIHSRESLMVLTALALLTCPLGCDKGEKKDPAKKEGGAKIEAEPEAIATSPGCTYDFTTSPVVDGSSLWSDIPDASNPANCNFHRFAYNNFLYMVDTPDGATAPRFMTELASTHVLAATGQWPTDAQKLKVRSIRNVPSSEFETGQAGDGFQLVDVAEQTVLYDIRINQTMWNSIAANTWNTSTGLSNAATAYQANSQTGGVWLPPNNIPADPSIQAPSGDDSIEIKTSWRNFGSDASACPSDIMFCMQDSDGNNLGLLGMHFVQKTPTRGEWIWASFEHVGNSPDCSPSITNGTVTQNTSNPLQQFPRDPTNPSATINVNKNVAALAGSTGWSAFNFSSYQTNGGDGTSCAFSQGTPAAANSTCTVTSTGLGPAACNGNPNPSGDGTTYVQVNVCRTDELPDHSTPTAVADVCQGASDPNINANLRNGNNVACITQSVLDHWPSGLEGVWKYYMLVGTEWLNATSVQIVGCFGITNSATSTHDFGCPQTPPQTFETTGTISLANTTMETWMQAQACITYSAGGKPTSVGATDCFSCHQPSTSTSHGDLSHAFSAF